MAKRANKAEREHMNRVAQLGCIICQRQAELHHPLRGKGMGLKSSHYEVIPLCIGHHRGDDGVHAGIKTFEKRFGTEAELLEKVRDRLGVHVL